MFPLHTIESAPEKSRAALAGSEKKFGFIPSPMAALASSPTAVEAFARVLALFDRSTLNALEREVITFTIARWNACHSCVALHSSMVDAQLRPLLRDGAVLPDPKLEALRQFTLRLLEGRGRVDEANQQAFFTAGYTHENALDVVVGLAAHTLSTFANRLTEAPLDAPLREFAW